MTRPPAHGEIAAQEVKALACDSCVEGLVAAKALGIGNVIISLPRYLLPDALNRGFERIACLHKLI